MFLILSGFKEINKFYSPLNYEKTIVFLLIPEGIELNQFAKPRDGPLIPVILYSTKHFLIKTLAFIVFLSESGFTLASKILVKTNDYSTVVVYKEIVNQTNVSFLKTIFSALQHMLHHSNELSDKRSMEVSKLIVDFAEKKVYWYLYLLDMFLP